MTASDDLRGPARLCAALPWNRLGALLGAVTVGLSQILFEIVLENPDHFPRAAGFHLWTLFWVLVLPFALLFGAETFLVRRWGRERAFRLWRAAVYGLLAASFIRQLQAHHAEAFDRLLGLELVTPLGLLAAAGVAFAAWRARTPAVHRFAASLGLLALLLAGLYVARSGLLGPAWRAAPRPEASGPQGEGAPVWILVCDELSYAALAPGGRLDAEAYPALASLAREGLWFTEATTNHQWTHLSIPTLMTGRRFPADGAPTLFQRLPERRSAMIIDPWLPTTQWIRRYGGDKDRLFFRGRSEFLDGRPLVIARHLAFTLAESAFVRLPAEAANRQGLSLYTTLDEEIELLLASADPAVAPGRITYWHCPLPHQPFVYRADGSPRDSALAFPKTPSKENPPDVEALWAAYREQIRYVDVLLGALVRRLKERGLYENAVLIVTSDHGLRTWGALEPEGYPDVRSGLVPRIPLLVRAPGLAPGVSDVDYQHIDFVPTLLDLLKIPYDPADFEGRSVLSGRPPPRTKSFYDDGTFFERAAGEELWRAAKPPPK